jgi:membrane-bound lytic murein transglycosylase D
MHGTAKVYGLNINSLIDERKDPLKASDAAARYLKDLYEIFDNWHLAIAAYNCGPKNINKAIARSGGKRDFWDIYPYLPRETRGYIPAYIAATYVMTNYEKHNLRPTDVDVPLETDTIMVDRNLFFAQITKFIPMDDAQIKLLNPQYKEPIIPGASQLCYLRLPMEYVPQFIRLQDSIYEYGMDSLVKQIVQDIKPTETITHTVRRNETLVKIAKRYGVTVPQIRSWNPRIRKNGMLKIGQRITIHRRNPLYNQIQYQAPQLLEKKQIKDAAVTDTLSETVISVVDVEKVQPKAKKTETPAKQTVYHSVRKGETLSSIARKYGTTVKKIKQLNGLKSDKLKIGKKLRVK